MESSQVQECLEKMEKAVNTLETAKEDYGLVKEAAFSEHGIARKADQRNLEKIAKARAKEKQDELRIDVDSAHDLLNIVG